MAAEPRWDITLPYGIRGEEIASGTIRALRDGGVRIEVKRKRRPDNRFYVELEHDPGRTGRYRPSGLSVSESELWAFVIADTDVVVFVPAVRLRAAIFELGWGSAVEETDGDCPTRGRLLSFGQLIATALDVFDTA